MMESPELGSLQRWMQAVMMHPGGVHDDIGAQDEITIPAGELERVVTSSRALSARERLGIYCGAYYARLLECLREEFTALVHALGQELFDEFAVEYLQAYPSRSYTLHDLGANFPRHLAETCPRDDDSGWAAMLIDLATLERAYNEIFDGPGVEGRTLLAPERLLAIAAENWPDARLIPVANLRLMTLRSPAHEYISALRRSEDPAPPQLEETYLAVHRRDYVVRRYPLSQPQYALLGALAAGKPVAAAIGQVIEAGGIDPGEFATALQDWFREWAAEGFFEDVEVPRSKGDVSSES